MDYAHTPDALEHALLSLQLLRREVGLQSKIIVVFGCGGNRDKGKRPKMGEIACDLADIVVVTSDNPRDEKPQDIIDDICKGIEMDNLKTCRTSFHFGSTQRHFFCYEEYEGK